MRQSSIKSIIPDNLRPMKLYLLRNDIVINIIAGTTDFADELIASGRIDFYLNAADVPRGTIGDFWDGTQFISPSPGDSYGPITRLQFTRRFTSDEITDIVNSTDRNVKTFLMLLRLAEDVMLDDTDTTRGVNYMEQIGLIGVGRAAQVLAPLTPEEMI